MGTLKSVADIGSAECAFYQYFNCSEYYAYDIDVEKPRSALIKTSHHTLVQEAHSLDITREPAPSKSELVFCIQVMIGNLSFDMNNIPDAIKNQVHSTLIGGTLIFNIKANQSLLANVRRIVTPEFGQVKLVRYGVCNFRIKHPLSSILGLILYALYKVGIPLPGNRYAFICTSKINT